jgi:hypothetical protein
MNTPTSPQAAPVRRWKQVQTNFALAVLAAALLFAGLVWLKDRMFTIDPGDGTPIGLAVRTDRHVAQLIQTLEPYVPSPNRDHSKNTFAISLYLVPLDGSKPKHVPLRRRQPPTAFVHAKLLGSDGRALWFDVAGTGAVDLTSFKLLRPAELRDPPPKPKSTSALPFGPKVEHHLAAGLFVGANEWLALLSAASVQGDYGIGRHVKRIVHADERREPRRLYRAVLEGEAMPGRYPIASMEPLSTAEYLNAAFVRPDDASEPLRLTNPDGVLMIYTSAPGLTGTLVAARVDLAGTVRWTVDTGVDRFSLKQILPGETSTVFVGTRPPVPGKVSEPLLVLVEHADGSARTVSLLVR